MSKVEYNELISFHPGYYINELLEYTGMSRNELSKRLHISEQNMDDLIDGKINLSEKIAVNLSIVFGTSVSMWLNLNQKYLEKTLQIERRNKTHST